MMQKILSLITLCFFVCFPVYLLAETTENEQQMVFNKEAFIKSAKQKRVLRIGLVDCIAYALKNNSEIKIKDIEPKLKE
ncbi:MAG: hypothetical protein KAS87_06080, partial [Candidatus Omnitrophica bacterium]|nr:hypothetical protein [Candidatus Omnitrophota bacterium]